MKQKKKNKDWQERFDAMMGEVFFSILGDVTYVADVVDEFEAFGKELDKRILHEKLSAEVKHFIQQELDSQREELIEKLEGMKVDEFRAPSGIIRNTAINDAIEQIKK